MKFLVFPSILFATIARADSVLDNLGIISPIASGDGYVGFSLIAVGIILVAAFAIGILSIESFPLSIIAKLRGNIHASNLFLRVKFCLVKKNRAAPPVFSFKNDPEDMEGFLRSLDFEGATIVSRKPIELGSMIRLDLASLPRFYNGRYQLAGEVVNVQKIGSGEDYLAKVQFASIPHSVKEPLTNYLKQLTA